MLQEEFGMEGERLWTVASGFGGGISGHQSVCGALTAGVMALGFLEARNVDDLGAKKISGPVRPRVRRLIDTFKESFGGIECRQLVKYDFDAPGGHDAHDADREEKERCSGYVRYVTEFVIGEFSGPRAQ